MPYEYEDEAEIYRVQTSRLTWSDAIWIVVGAALIVFGMKLILQ